MFNGRGGNSRYLTPVDYTGSEPRFGFAWSPKALKEYHVTMRGGYAISHAPVSGTYRLPQPDFGAMQPFATTVPSSTANPNYVMRLGENPPVIIPQTPAQTINAPANGLVTLNSLYYQAGIGGYAVSSNFHTPYVQNWNFTISWHANPTTAVEAAYVGNKGTHLFVGRENLNPKDLDLLSAQHAANVNTTATANDPLGRINPGTGRTWSYRTEASAVPTWAFPACTGCSMLRPIASGTRPT